MKEVNEMDKLFREKLANYEQAPPDYLLNKILAGAAAANRQKKLIIWRVAGIAAALLLAFIAGWQINTPETKITTTEIATINSGKQTSVKPLLEVKTTKPAIKTTGTATLGKLIKIENKRTVVIRDNSKAEQIASLSESKSSAKNSRSASLKPISILSGLINQNGNSEIRLQLLSIRNAEQKSDFNAVDHQIMALNHENLLADNSVSEKAHWSVGAQVSPNYSVSRSSHSKEYASNMLNSGTSNPIDLGGGISVEYKAAKRWSLQSGVYYSALDQSSGNASGSGSKNSFYADASIGSDYFNTPVNIDVSSSKMMMNSTAGVIELNNVPSGIQLGTSLEEKTLATSVILSQASFVQNFEYIEIPLYLRYTLIDSRFNVEMLGGLSSNILVGNETYMDNGSGKNLIGKTQDMEALNYSGTLGVGFKYGLTKSIFLNVEPRVKYYLNSLNSNTSVTYKPYTVGVFTGLSYQF